MRYGKITPAPSSPETELDEIVPNFQPVTLTRQRHDGWTAERQRTFLVALAETGCISEACRCTGITARSAYRLRAHPLGKNFADGWDQALRYATARLMTLAYERAIRGSVRETWRDGKLIAETRAPSDRCLTFILGSLAPFRRDARDRWGTLMQASGDAASDLAPVLAELADCDVACDALADADFLAQPPASADPRIEPFDPDFAEDDEWAA